MIRLATPDDAPALARISVDAWRWAYADIVDPAVLARMTYSKREEGWRNQFQTRGARHTFFVDEREGVLTGFSITGPHREEEPATYDGELYAVYVRPEWVGKGIGSALFDAGVAEVRRHAFRRMMVWCFEANSLARNFYERKGGVHVADKIFRLVDRDYPEVGYGWEIGG